MVGCIKDIHLLLSKSISFAFHVDAGGKWTFLFLSYHIILPVWLTIWPNVNITMDKA